MTEPVCNCNDEHVTTPCPVHPNAIPVEQPVFRFVEDEEEVYIVTDENMQKDMWVRWEGWGFVCPVCNNPSIMVNKDMYNRCVAPGCGVKVAIQSKIITDFIRKGVVPQELVYRKK